MERILVVNMNYMGDALMTVPAMSALRRAYPNSVIDTIAGTGAAADVLKFVTEINAIIPRTSHSSFGRCRQLYQVIRNGKYDTVVILPKLPAYALTAWLTRIPLRAGLSGTGMDAFLTHKATKSNAHLADQLLAVAESVIQADRNCMAPGLGKEVKDECAVELQEDVVPNLVGIHIGSTREQKRWPNARVEQLIQRIPDLAVVLLGAGERDIDQATALISSCKHSNLRNMVGSTDIEALAMVIQQCRVLVTGDSGPMHLASYLGVPTVALFGSTDPKVTGPYDSRSSVIYKSLPCAPCNSHPSCNGAFTCMQTIDAQEVEAAVRLYFPE